MPRAWLHRKPRRTKRMPTELTILRSNNPANEHPKFCSGDNSYVAAHRKRRLVSQNGRIKVANTNVPGKRERYFGDLFTTILDMPFHWILGIYSIVYLASWSGFGTVWYLIHYLRGRHGFEDYYCVDNVDSWTTAFLFSIETQTTIGYGGRQVGFIYVFLNYLDWTVGGLILSCGKYCEIFTSIVVNIRYIVGWYYLLQEVSLFVLKYFQRKHLVQNEISPSPHEKKKVRWWWAPGKRFIFATNIPYMQPRLFKPSFVSREILPWYSVLYLVHALHFVIVTIGQSNFLSCHVCFKYVNQNWHNVFINNVQL